MRALRVQESNQFTAAKSNQHHHQSSSSSNDRSASVRRACYTLHYPTAALFMVLIVKIKKRREHDPASSVSPASLDAEQAQERDGGDVDGGGASFIQPRAASDEAVEQMDFSNMAAIKGSVQADQQPSTFTSQPQLELDPLAVTLSAPAAISSTKAHEVLQNDAESVDCEAARTNGIRRTQCAVQANDIDALTGAFERTGISSDGTAGDGAPFTAESSPDGVGVFIAPAVLGHRWVRSRSTEYIVERPERLRASMLGIAALLGRRYDSARRNVVASMAEVGPISTDSAALDNSGRASLGDEQVHSATLPVHLLLSRERVALDSPHQGLAMVHALEEEFLSTGDMVGEPPAYTRATPSTSLAHTNWLTAPIAYSAYIHALCRLAPAQEPSAPMPRSSRQMANQSPKEESEGHDINTDDVKDAIRPSEVPDHLPQGDLYLCGIQQAHQRFKNDRTESADTPVTPPTLDARKRESELDASMHTLQPATPPIPTPFATGSTAKVDAKADLLREGSLGAIEASLGACCAALDHVVHAARRQDNGASIPRAKLVRRFDMGDLHRIKGATEDEVPLKDRRETLPTCRRAFVLARPPGHHCSANRPSGFCWVNNVAVTAMHAYATHRIDRVIVLDFDLHHGDGTQSIVWRINAQTVVADADRAARLKALKAEREAHTRSRGAHRSHAARQAMESTKDGDNFEGQLGPRGLKMFYGSLHDIESFPCEDGDKGKVSDASVCVAGAHGQWIWNVHLDAHANEDEYEKAYRGKYAQLFRQAELFLDETDSRPDASLIVISAGFDANVYEHAGMQRHGKSVPPSFYTRFTRDAVRLAEKRCGGKCISVLEGGYSDRALMTGVAAHVAGLSSSDGDEGAALCEPSVLTQLDKVSKAAYASLTTRTRSGEDRSGQHTVTSSGDARRRRPDLTLRDPDWLRYTLEALQRMQMMCGKVRSSAVSTVVGSAPATPTASGTVDVMATSRRTPRETRASRAALASAHKASPSAGQSARENDAAAGLLSLHG